MFDTDWRTNLYSSQFPIKTIQSGLLIGYYETDSVNRSQRSLDENPDTAEWEAQMAGFFVSLDGRPDQNAVILPEIFNLDDQLHRSEKDAP